MDKSASHRGRGGGRQHGGRYRSQHRARNHAAAEEEAKGQSIAAVPDHPLIAGGEAELVETPDAWEQLVAELREAGWFAYDTEFIGELSYHPQLCVVQVATTSKVALVDPMAGLDMTPLWELLADDTVGKIVHAGQQDLEPVVRHLGRGPARVFDTQIVAGFVGQPYPVALRHLVDLYVGVKLGKGMTFTHWDQRPLTPVQRRYAADDVRYLPALKEALDRDVAAAGHGAWVEDELRTLTDAGQYRSDAMSQLARFRGNRSMRRKDLGCLRELLVWRDQAAREEDAPPRSLVKDETLLGMAQRTPRTVEELYRVRHLPRPVVDRWGKAILEAMTRGVADPVSHATLHSLAEESAEDRARIDSLWSAATAWCYARRLDPALVTSRQEVSRLYRAWREGREPVGLRLLTGWRREALGEPLREMLAGRASVHLGWGAAGLELRGAGAG